MAIFKPFSIFCVTVVIIGVTDFFPASIHASPFEGTFPGEEKQGINDEKQSVDITGQNEQFASLVSQLSDEDIKELTWRILKNLYPGQNLVQDFEHSRSRRDVDTPLPLPTSSSTSQDNSFNGFPLPYAWPPLYSGQCNLCPAGRPGPRGPPGPMGVAGRDGRDGRDAALITGVPQSVDPSRTASMDSPASSPSCTQQGASANASGGIVYTRWGNSVCPEGADLIYTGTIGGSLYTHAGSGANHLCMPHQPIYNETDAANDDRGLLYSSEYQTSTSPERLRSVHDHTPTCAVCRAPNGRTTQLMVPARNVCPSDEWRLEYAGYLMSGKQSHKRSEFICVDSVLDTESGTSGNQNGALLYMVEGRCLTGGGLPCGPYVNGYELTCAVCTI